ncbi:MAG TPA: hypothetical protein DEH78_15045 [Solibacterales bacterium]|nr:hypothetical protein [Bryobacterales bacterium]
MIEKTEGKFEIVLGQRQLATTLFLLLMQMGVVAGVAYMAGRAVTAAQFARGENGVVSSKGPGQVLVVDPPSTTSSYGTATAAPLPATVAPRPEVTRKAATMPVTMTLDPDPEPASGELYLQVGSVERGMAEVFVEVLKRRNLPAKYIPGVKDNVYRVLVGPLAKSQLTSTGEQLTELGFSGFPRRF